MNKEEKLMATIEAMRDYEVIDLQVFDYDISIDEAKGYYEQAKVNLTEIKNLIDSLMI